MTDREAIDNVRNITREDGCDCDECVALDRVTSLAESALAYQIGMWLSLPGGIDEDADPDDRSPEDLVTHIGGLAVREGRAALKEVGRFREALSGLEES